MLLKNTAREAACAEEFLRQLEKKRRELTFLPTVSYGSAPFSGEDVVAIKDQADRAMYHHKKRGRSGRRRLCRSNLDDGCKKRIEYKYATI